MVVSSRPRAFEELHQDAHLVVDLLDQAHIGRDDFFARLVARHVAGIAHVHIGGEHRMRVGAFLLRADRRLHVLRPVHAGVGLRRDIGPMRLDVGQMQAPRPAVIFGFRNELHRAPRHVGRLGMLVRHACGLVGVHQQPAVLQSSRPRPRRNWPSAPTDWGRRSRAGADNCRRPAAADRSDAGRRRAHRVRSRIPTRARR